MDNLINRHVYQLKKVALNWCEAKLCPYIFDQESVWGHSGQEQ